MFSFLWGAGKIIKLRLPPRVKPKLGLGPDRTESYLLAIRKPAPTVAGDRRHDAESGPLGVHLGVLLAVHSG